jgi:hypothetical protein
MRGSSPLRKVTIRRAKFYYIPKWRGSNKMGEEERMEKKGSVANVLSKSQLLMEQDDAKEGDDARQRQQHAPKRERSGEADA